MVPGYQERGAVKPDQQNWHSIIPLYSLGQSNHEVSTGQRGGKIDSILGREGIQNRPSQNVALWQVDYFKPKAIKTHKKCLPYS